MASKNVDSVYKREDLNWVTHTHCFIQTKKKTQWRGWACVRSCIEKERLTLGLREWQLTKLRLNCQRMQYW